MRRTGRRGRWLTRSATGWSFIQMRTCRRPAGSRAHHPRPGGDLPAGSGVRHVHRSHRHPGGRPRVTRPGPIVDVRIEPRVGGASSTELTSGELYQWGTVLTWEPGRRYRQKLHHGPGPGAPQRTRRDGSRADVDGTCGRISRTAAGRRETSTDARAFATGRSSSAGSPCSPTAGIRTPRAKYATCGCASRWTSLPHVQPLVAGGRHGTRNHRAGALRRCRAGDRLRRGQQPRTRQELVARRCPVRGPRGWGRNDPPSAIRTTAARSSR